MGSCCSSSDSDEPSKSVHHYNSFSNEASELEQTVNKVKASIDNDPSLPNLFSNLALLLQRPTLISSTHFCDRVNESKEKWANILQTVKKFSATNKIDEEQVKEIDVIHNDYWVLLLRTRVGIAVLIKKYELQRSNVQTLLEIIQEYRRSNKGALSKDDQIACGECIAELGNWLKTGELDSLIEEWSDMQTRLRALQENWKDVQNNSVVVALAGVVLVGNLCYQVLSASKDEYHQKEISPLIVKVNPVQERLLKMITNSNRDYKSFKSAVSSGNMETSLKAINKYLEECIKQCQCVNETVDKACRESINNIK